MSDTTGYVDEYRKISTVQKLVPPQNKYQFFIEADDKEKNNFIRLRKEPNYQIKSEMGNKLVLKNEFIEATVNNDLSKRKNEYIQRDQGIKNDLNQNVSVSRVNRTERDDTFKFFYGPAKCLLKKAQQGSDNDFQKYAIFGLNNDDENMSIGKKKAREKNILNQKEGKYDFKQINRLRMQTNQQQEEIRQNNKLMEETINTELFLALKKYDKYRDLREIEEINEIQWIQEDFRYQLDRDENQNLQFRNSFGEKLIYESVFRRDFDTQLNIQYFRDIGLPAWNMQKYEKYIMEKKGINLLTEEALKEKVHTLHLLREEQLNLHKKNLNFFDMANISTGRILSVNAYMCIRSEKITRVQYDQLLRRLNRQYKRQESQIGKKMEQKRIGTDDIQGLLDDDSKNENNQNFLALASQTSQKSYLKYVNQIQKIKQQGEKLKRGIQQADILVNKHHLQQEKNDRIRHLLQKLYQVVCISPGMYPYQNIQSFCNKPEEILKQQFKNGQILWYILDVRQQIKRKITEQDNIINLLSKNKQIDQPVLYQFKNAKLLKQQKLSVKNLYTYRDKNVRDQTDKQQKPRKPQNNNQSNKQVPDNIKPSKNKSLTPNKPTAKKPILSPFKGVSNAKTQKKLYK